MSAPHAPEPLVGGRYAWREQLGRGGFGVVWRAHDTLLQRDVAVKAVEVPASLGDDEQAAVRRKVLREARAAARLNHPGLVTVFDVVEADGRPLIVMELVRAPTLAAIVDNRGPLPEAEVAAIGLEVLEALEVAHGQGIVHRDVKPANVMVSDAGHVQLADFGIAAITDDSRVTSSGLLAGSPAYMSPEQASSAPATPATDLWGLGTTLYFAVEGEPPFRRDGAIATLTAVVNEPHRPMARAKGLAPVIESLLAKDPDARPSPAEVRRRLTDVVTVTAAPGPNAMAPAATIVTDPTVAPDATITLDPAAVSAPVEPPATAGPVELPATAAPVEPPPVEVRPPVPPERRVRGRRRRDRPPVAVAAVVAVVLLGVLGVVIVANRGGRSTTSSFPQGPGAHASPTTSATAGSEAGATPTGWVAYRDPTTGFTIAHPPGWAVSVNGTLTDFRDPASGAYLRVDHREPPGPSAEGAWYEYEPSFAAQNPGYRRIRITPTTYRGYPAAIWEYAYSGGGAELHAVDLGFITPGHGFALNFQATAGDWDRLQSTFDGFKTSFRAPSA